MYLVNVVTKQLQCFRGQEVPDYAILSHRWGDEAEEVSFQDMAESPLRRKGYEKIDYCCKQAVKDGLQYAWVDTCCIDKHSSVELSEAINSMYSWYAHAKVCYVYLNDVHAVDDMRASAWFRRGRTLQELLAPKHMCFFNRAWDEIGTKHDLIADLAAITCIRISALERFDPRDYSVAERMSWASDRATSRIEDEAYCLLGIFDIHMPLLYGEGRNAFQRLQEEIMRESNDLSLFYWKGASCPTVSMLAARPSNFAFLKSPDGVALTSWPVARPPTAPFWLNNAGISMQLDTRPHFRHVYIGYLPLWLEPPHVIDRHTIVRQYFQIGIFLRYDPYERIYSRVVLNGESWFLPERPYDNPLEMKIGVKVLVSPRPLTAWRAPEGNVVSVELRFHDIDSIFEAGNATTGKDYDWGFAHGSHQRKHESRFSIQHLGGEFLVGSFYLCLPKRGLLAVWFGFDGSGAPICLVCPRLSPGCKSTGLMSDSQALRHFRSLLPATSSRWQARRQSPLQVALRWHRDPLRRRSAHVISITRTYKLWIILQQAHSDGDCQIELCRKLATDEHGSLSWNLESDSMNERLRM